jgi:lambda family phage minor tail protein L
MPRALSSSTTGHCRAPRLRVANVQGLIGVLNRAYNNLNGATLIRRRTLVKFLDAVNFPGGVNASADPLAGYPDDVWRIDRKAHQDAEFCEYELGSPIDVADAKLPGRALIARICGWQYRSAECGYSGGAVAKADDTATVVLSDDKCGHRLASCRLRFPRPGAALWRLPGLRPDPQCLTLRRCMPTLRGTQRLSSRVNAAAWWSSAPAVMAWPTSPAPMPRPTRPTPSS